jgi:hypothetical protein
LSESWLAKTMCKTQEADGVQPGRRYGGGTAYSLRRISQRIARMRESTTMKKSDKETDLPSVKEKPGRRCRRTTRKSNSDSSQREEVKSTEGCAAKRTERTVEWTQKLKQNRQEVAASRRLR